MSSILYPIELLSDIKICVGKWPNILSPIESYFNSKILIKKEIKTKITMKIEYK